VNFFKQEKVFLLSLILLVFASLFAKEDIVRQSDLLTGIVFIIIFTVIIINAFRVVMHAEILANRFGEPYGTMILTFSAVTVEVIMVAAMMLHEDTDPTLARDTIFSTVMILMNGIIGIIMLLGGFKYGDQKYNLKSSNSFFSMILGLLGLSLFMPLFIPENTYTVFEAFLIIASILLYAFFLRMQSKEHNYYFKFKDMQTGITKNETHVEKGKSTAYHITMLLLTIGVISFLAEYLSITVDDAIAKLSLPAGVASLIISIIIVSPEGLTALRAGLSNDMQRVINISLGSALSTISLTIPAVLLVGFIFNRDVILGITPLQGVLLIISMLVGMLSYKDGETNSLQGFIHLILFITFVFIIFLI
jgi:Ca2+:H+ antiporter